MHETIPIVPNDNVEEIDKPDVAMNTYDMTTPIKNKITYKRTSKNPKIITVDFNEDALQTEHYDPQRELVNTPKAKTKARSAPKRETKETIVEWEIISIDLNTDALRTELVKKPTEKINNC